MMHAILAECGGDRSDIKVREAPESIRMLVTRERKKFVN